METTRIAKAEPIDMKLEVVMLGVTDIDRAKAFYQNLGWRLAGTLGSDRPAAFIEDAVAVGGALLTGVALR